MMNTINYRKENEPWNCIYTSIQKHLTEHYCINFWSSASLSDATFCTAWYNRLLVVLYFMFIKNLLILLQSVSWSAHPKYNTHCTKAYWTGVIVLIHCLHAVNVLFIHSAVGSRGEAPTGDLGDRVPRSWSIFKVHSLKFKARWK